MKLINQSHEILSISPNIPQMIELAGRTCYKSEDKITSTFAEKFVAMLQARKHDAMLEFGYITVRFITNRGVSHELVRHRLCSFAQESTRYVRYDGEIEFIKPIWWDKFRRQHKIGSLIKFENYLIMSEEIYKCLLDEEWSPQQAREVLPNALKTEIVVKANIREWIHIFKLSCSKAAHPQMRALMIPLLEELKVKIPSLFDGIEK